ncbi:MAG: MYXO-CTERM sorting domain-containing protein [Proteobacteria bacterium]|nr:MYXO-CTERM sorting domain-containing protein [Pseudomonadota bacterium]
MIFRKRSPNWAISIALLVIIGGCDSSGGGCLGELQDLPRSGLPQDQTIEGAAQIRLTQSGVGTVTQYLDELAGDTLAEGFCLPEQDVLLSTICHKDDGKCQPGCLVEPTKTAPVEVVPLNDTDMLQARIQINAVVDIPVDNPGPFDCTLRFTLTGTILEADMALGIAADNGELTLELDRVDSPNFEDTLEGDGCLGLAELLEALAGLFKDDIIAEIRSVLEEFIDDALPDPLGIEGIMDLSELIGPYSYEERVAAELVGLAGGYVDVANDGISLGLIFGFNTDRNPRTRRSTLDSEPARCVPAMSPPDFSGKLATSTRGNFQLLPTDMFLGNPEAEGDVAIGVSETAVDLIGHHAITSGALCLSVGSEVVPELNLGTVGLLLPSLARLGSESGNDPLLVLTRPVNPLDFTFGEGTEASPSLQVTLKDFEIDLYAFVLERYVRALTLKVTADVGVNIEPTTTDDGKPALMLVLVGLEAENIQVMALNAEFLAESTEKIESVMPIVLDLVLPLLTGAIPDIELPEIVGFQLNVTGTTKIITSEDQFLSVGATLTSAPKMAQLAATGPSVAANLDLPAVPFAPARVDTRARLRTVHTPSPEVIRAGLTGPALSGQANHDLPEIVIDVEPFDELGRALEWTWNIDGGMWRSFTRATPLVIRDRSLALQGRKLIGVRARVVGDYRTLDADPVVIPVVIDSAPPRIHADRAQVADGVLVVPASDLVSPDQAIEFAFGRSGHNSPATLWSHNGLDAGELAELADGGKLVTVYARDQQGNISSAAVDVEAAGAEVRAASGGCSASSSTSSAGALVLVGLALLMLAMRRRRHISDRAGRPMPGRSALLSSILMTVAVLGLASAVGCGGSGGDDPRVACEVDADCADACSGGASGLCGAPDVGICIARTCECLANIDLRIGRFSDMSLSPAGGVWVSAYNEEQGDLTVTRRDDNGIIEETAWEFVDGVPPDAPVAIEGSDRREGKLSAGDDVGKYTSIAVNQDDEAMVTYFDEKNASLKFAGKFGGAWQIHTVDEGKPGSDPETGFEIVGQYSSITVRTDNGYPGIAYYVYLADTESGEIRSEVRFAGAQTAKPTSAGDWAFYTVDQVVLSPADTASPLAIPPGVGLFIDSARLSDGAPVVVYYDRINGDLKLARFDPDSNEFQTPVILDGSGADAADVGWYPSIAADSDDNLHVSYVKAGHDGLLYINSLEGLPEMVDDGYREERMTDDVPPLPIPEFHRVGDDSSIVMTDSGPAIAYQDATSHELRLAVRDDTGVWHHKALPPVDPQNTAGGYGFYISAAPVGNEVVISNWAVDLPTECTWIEISRTSVDQIVAQYSSP